MLCIGVAAPGQHNSELLVSRTGKPCLTRLHTVGRSFPRRCIVASTEAHASQPGCANLTLGSSDLSVWVCLSNRQTGHKRVVSLSLASSDATPFFVLNSVCMSCVLGCAGSLHAAGQRRCTVCGEGCP